MRRTNSQTGPATNQAPRTRAHVAQLLATAEQVRGNRDHRDRNVREPDVTPAPEPSRRDRDQEQPPASTPAPTSAVERDQGAVSPVQTVFASARREHHPSDAAEFSARNLP